MAAIPIATTCQRCGGSNVKLRRTRIRNGTYQIAYECLDCNRRAQIGGPSLPHKAVATFLRTWGKNIDDIPVARDYTGQTACVICGKPGDYHHWAPQKWARHFGSDWYVWPGAYLCQEHHALWHRIVTPALVGLKGETYGK